MSNRPAIHTQTDINRAVRAAAKAGDGAVVELRPDGIIQITFNGKKPPPDDEGDGGDVIL
jgi:hypothetical protein